MKDVLRPILELTVVFPGLLLAYFPVRSYLKQSSAKLAVWEVPLLFGLCLGGGLFCYHFGLSTAFPLLLITIVTIFLYLKTLRLSLWKSGTIALAVCAVFACLNSLSRAVGTAITIRLQLPPDKPWFCFSACIFYNVICWLTAAAAYYPSTHSVRAMVDFFLVITIAGAGDDLQGIKKGVIETADAILVNKADGDNKTRAQAARAEYEQVLRYLRPATEGWTTGAYTCSAITGEGVEGIWNVILGFIKQTRRTGVLESRRGSQTMEWVKSMTDDYIRTMIYSNPRVQKCMDELSGQVMSGEMPPTLAAKELIDTIEAALKA